MKVLLSKIFKMRDLTAKQKKLLVKWFKEQEPSQKEKMLFNKSNPIRSVMDLSLEQYEELEQINDTEVLYQNVNNFIHDLIMN